ncbi:hypothetical protein Poli38472_007635 [Pythium oligandrum]|uniref:Uncharacterized protein n=1 Tax=Pythium oligandrum TaxID=41045 RepID=A0A8K1FRV8_PYTOL|nr:hypothetical protein Poli38472_007635 [Pythium oligandrum]|eukprot:TMW67963.1 hypothetical protein Poli38472_007635 [Pythium oligandrum]
MAIKSTARYSTFTSSPRAEGAAPHPYTTAWWGSRLLLSWVSPLMSLGQQKQLDMDDVWPLQRRYQSEFASQQFTRDFETTRSIPKAFFKSFGWRFVLTGVGFFVALLCTLVGPIVLNHVVSSLTSPSFSIEDVSVWVGLLFVSQVFQALVDQFSNFESELVAIEFVGCLKSLLYTKTMRLSAQARMEKSTGEITNIYTSDSDSLLATAYFVHQLWLLPLQISIVVYMLYDILDVAAFAGIGVIVVMLVINRFISKGMFAIQRVYRDSKDARMKKVTEVFKAINIVKFNAWEEKFMERIEETRAKELKDLFTAQLYVAASIVLMWGMPVFISIASFGVYSVVLHRELTPAIVFTSLTLFQMIQGPLRFITDLITMLIQSKVALERVAKFLDMSEINSDNVLSIEDVSADEYIKKNVIVSVENATFGWDESSMVLRDVNLEIKPGEFYVVHGTVGCGKSSLCSALLGEMIKKSGQVYVGGTVAYCSQQAWIQNMTVRENILFGKPYDRKKYEKVLDACALTKDLASLASGDQTEIGERGVNVSGGQKARIALARACYSDASIYILDSPLSAVDAIVQNEIFNKCLLGLLRHKTIILVTHNPEIIASEYITHAVTIDETGKLVETRKIQTRPVYDSAVTPLAAHAYVKRTFEEEPDVEVSDKSDVPSYEEVAEIQQELALASPFKEDKVKSFGVTDAETKEAIAAGKLIIEENRSEGRVGWHVFEGYYHAIGGLPVLTIILLSQVLWQVLQVASDFWLGSWSSDSVSEAGNVASTEYRLGVFSILGLASAFMVVVRTVMIAYFGLRAAKNLFDRMTNSLMHAPMRFFDVNPIGRILTRYGSDVATVDSRIPTSFGTLFARLFSVGTSAVTAAVVIQWKGFLLLPVVFLYYQIGAFYIQPARELQRLIQTAQAPPLNHLSESIDGGSVLRAFGRDQIARFTSTNFQKLDNANKVWYAQLCVSQWFSLRIQLLGSLLVLVVTSSLVLLHNELSPAVIGIAFSYALKVSQNLESIVQSLTRIETIMVSPERLQEYIEIPQEASHRIPSMDPPKTAHWPNEGSIEFDQVSFRYKEGDRLVLQNMSLKIEGGEKIGIVGRTGAGKSSLTMALFRINELASGSVSIDGVNVSTIGLKTLREKLSIIPQNPVLFKGTLRSYLDPFGEFSDDELWSCIRKVGLGDRISNEEKKLECPVEENGENFSVGERQMLCMARALSRHSRIVIFDEATAAIDHETDQKLQRVIREAFEQSTVLTIAHRLDTILDADRILVLEGGRVVEFASPAELVKKGSGHFFELMQEGGYLEKFLSGSPTHSAHSQ